MPNEPKDMEGQKHPRIRRGRVDSVDLYEIKDGELDMLERGSPADLQLNFAIFLFSTAFTAIAALATATFTSGTAKTFFIIVVVVGIVLGGYLLLSWYRTRRSLKELCKSIRSRIPPDVPPPPAPKHVDGSSETPQPSG